MKGIQCLLDVNGTFLAFEKPGVKGGRPLGHWKLHPLINMKVRLREVAASVWL